MKNKILGLILVTAATIGIHEQCGSNLTFTLMALAAGSTSWMIIKDLWRCRR